tara:strand:- start:219 stop:755 length:537 start_codon:yes stop_codon:yes gene_type:complete
MAKLKYTPDNFSYLSPVGFQFAVNKLPNVEYFCQGVTLPGISLQGIPVQTPFTAIPIPGDRIEFQELLIRFIIDEDMKNYIEIFEWMKGLGFPDNFDQYKEVQKSDPQNLGPESGIVSDAVLLILSGASTANLKFTFKDAFPTQLTSLTFDTNNEDIQYLQADATFTYRSFDIETLND